MDGSGIHRKVELGVLVLFHGFIVGGNITSFFVVPFLEPFYVSIPIMSLILLLMFSRVIDCPLTNLENHYRKSLGMKRIGGFVGHYLIKPWRRSWARMKR